MRPVERIDGFLAKVDLFELLKNNWKLDYSDLMIQLRVNTIRRNLQDISEKWKLVPDLRFSQVLVNLNYLPNFPGMWYYTEEDEILEEQGWDPALVNYWGVNYDKEKNLLPETVYKPISELESAHLEAILDGGYVDRNPAYKEIMEKELERREWEEEENEDFDIDSL